MNKFILEWCHKYYIGVFLNRIDPNDLDKCLNDLTAICELKEKREFLRRVRAKFDATHSYTISTATLDKIAVYLAAYFKESILIDDLLNVEFKRRSRIPIAA